MNSVFVVIQSFLERLPFLLMTDPQLPLYENHGSYASYTQDAYKHQFKWWKNIKIHFSLLVEFMKWKFQSICFHIDRPFERKAERPAERQTNMFLLPGINKESMIYWLKTGCFISFDSTTGAFHSMALASWIYCCRTAKRLQKKRSTLLLHNKLNMITNPRKGKIWRI